ncbi:MAG: pitrilysin family protein [Candidatus Aminicenantes bacterium]|nr:pitrilysin family protein [Candidatus Aminicenantes bacterium]
MKRLTHVLVIVLLLSLPLALAAGLRPGDITVHKLDNGLKIVLLEDHDIPNIAYYTFFRVGSRNERPGLTGVSHFIEHMMFNGTQANGPGQFDRIMEASGGANNAFTSEDMTGYTNWYPAAALEKMIELDADRMQGLIFDPKVLESERSVVASERRMGVENNNENLLGETVRATAIMAHPYHWDVIGWMSDILSWKRDEIIAYYRTFYSPNNAVIVVCGDFQTPKIMELIRKYYAAIPRGPEPPAVLTVEPSQLGPRRVVVHKPAQTPSFLQVYHAPAATDPDFPAMDVLGMALLQGESSRLYQRLVARDQLAIDVSGGIGQSIDPLLFTIAVKPRPGVDTGLIEKAIEEELARIKKDGIAEKELMKALNSVRMDFYNPLMTISGKAYKLGQSEIYYGGYEHIFKAMDPYKAVTLKQVQEAAGKYFSENNKTVGVLIPEGGSK